MLKKRIAFIGPGAMAEAMIAGLLKQKLSEPSSITAAGPREERGAELSRKYGIVATTANASAAHEADVVVLSVKPQRRETLDFLDLAHGQPLRRHCPSSRS